MNNVSTFLCAILLFVAASSFADTRVLEVSVVTDWETVSYYTSVDEIESIISSAFGHANNIFLSQLNIEIKVTHIDIPATEAEDTIANYTLVGNLANSLIAYRGENIEHASADVTVLFTKRNIMGSSNLIGFAMTGQVCNAKSVAIVELRDNGLDYLTLSHELAHILGAIHDGDPPCENEPPTGYLMASQIPSASQFLSQCSIEKITFTINKSGDCLYENNTAPVEEPPIEEPPVEVPPGLGGGGSTSIIFLLLLLFIMVVTPTRKADPIRTWS